jgi:hypothetical protein
MPAKNDKVSVIVPATTIIVTTPGPGNSIIATPTPVPAGPQTGVVVGFNKTTGHAQVYMDANGATLDYDPAAATVIP